jgi:FkbM family methyltransferase
LARSLRALGVDAHARENVPFGVDAFNDVAGLADTVSVAFDVGGNVGQTVTEMRRVFPVAQIYSFEPVPTTFAQLVDHYGATDRVECVQSAMGEIEGHVEMTASAISGQNTMRVSAKPSSPTVRVPVTTVDVFAAQRGIPRIDLLKIDTEGYELAVLRGAQRMLSTGSIRFVLAECEFTPNSSEPHGAFFEIAALLLPMGFRIVAFYTGGVDGDGWRWGDVLFMLPDGPHEVVSSPHARRHAETVPRQRSPIPRSR